MTHDFHELVIGGVLFAPFITYAVAALVIILGLRMPTSSSTDIEASCIVSICSSVSTSIGAYGLRSCSHSLENSSLPSRTLRTLAVVRMLPRRGSISGSELRSFGDERAIENASAGNEWISPTQVLRYSPGAAIGEFQRRSNNDCSMQASSCAGFHIDADAVSTIVRYRPRINGLLCNVDTFADDSMMPTG